MSSHDPASGPLALESDVAFPMMASRVDLLSQVLTLIRLRGELIFSADLTAPWGLTFEPGSAYFHVVSEGEVEIVAADGRQVQAEAGDLIVLPQGRGHRIGIGGGRPVSARQVLEDQVTDGKLAIRLGGGGALTRLVTGPSASRATTCPPCWRCCRRSFTSRIRCGPRIQAGSRASPTSSSPRRRSRIQARR